MHVDIETIQRLIHEELPDDDRDRVLAHAASCARCEAALEEARREDTRVFALIDGLAVDTPALSAEVVAERALADPRRTRWSLRWAASVVLMAAAAGGAYAAPGSPVPGWIEQLVAPDPVPVPPLPSDPTDFEGGSGIIVGTDLESIHIPELHPRSTLLVSTDDSLPGIAVRTGQPGTTFDSDPDRVTVVFAQDVENDVLVTVPPDAGRLRIVVGGRTVWARRGGAVSTSMELGTDGIYRLSGGP